MVAPEKKGAPLEFIHMLNLAIKEEIATVKFVSERIMVPPHASQCITSLTEPAVW